VSGLLQQVAEARADADQAKQARAAAAAEAQAKDAALEKLRQERKAWRGDNAKLKSAVARLSAELEELGKTTSTDNGGEEGARETARQELVRAVAQAGEEPADAGTSDVGVQTEQVCEMVHVAGDADAAVPVPEGEKVSELGDDVGQSFLIDFTSLSPNTPDAKWHKGEVHVSGCGMRVSASGLARLSITVQSRQPTLEPHWTLGECEIVLEAAAEGDSRRSVDSALHPTEDKMKGFVRRLSLGTRAKDVGRDGDNTTRDEPLPSWVYVRQTQPTAGSPSSIWLRTKTWQQLVSLVNSMRRAQLAYISRSLHAETESKCAAEEKLIVKEAEQSVLGDQVKALARQVEQLEWKLRVAEDSET